MKQKEILKKCDSYIELFNDLKNEERNNIIEFSDFAYLHLPENSNLAFEINQLGSGKFSEHAKRIKDFIKVNGSKTIKHNNNFISDKNNFELLSILFAFCLFGFGIGYWAKTFEVFTVLEKNKNPPLPRESFRMLILTKYNPHSSAKCNSTMLFLLHGSNKKILSTNSGFLLYSIFYFLNSSPEYFLKFPIQTSKISETI